jgi:hypothetical protein
MEEFMRKSIIILAVIFLSFSFLSAQSYKGKQRGIQLDSDAMMQLFDQEPDLQKMAGFFFKMDYDQVEKLVKSKGLEADMEETTIYFDTKKMRADMTQDGEKFSYMMNFETNMMYTVMWDKKEYMEMDIDQMRQIQKQAMSQMDQQMEKMKGMMDQMPPEARAAMEKMYGKKDKNPPQVKPTGKTAKINGFNCKEYHIIWEDKISQYWITTDYNELRKTFEEFATSVPEMEDNDKAVWEQIGEGWPARDAEVSLDPMGMGASYSINEFYALEKTTHDAGTFTPPSGFKKKSMQEMMMDGMQDYE